MVKFSSGLRNSMATTDGITHVLANGIVEIYSGAQPADADQAVTGTLLMTITLASGSFTPGSPTNGINFDPPILSGGLVILPKDVDEVWSGNGVASGVAGWARFKGNATDAGAGSTTLPRIDMSVGAGGADLNLVSTTIAGPSPGPATPITLDTFQITLPPSNP